jgi:CHAT domain-containing protein/Tfp pilus assembly protein PilF
MNYFAPTSNRGYRFTAIMMFVLFVHSGFAVAANQQKAEPAASPELKLQEKVERALSGGEAHSYRITLKTEQYLRVVVEQKGIDVAVTLFAPNGQKLAEVDSPNGTQGPEPVGWIAQAAGEYQLNVKSAEAKAAPGRYEIKVEELRDATQRDRDRTAAERALVEAEQFRVQRTAEALQKALDKFDEALTLWKAIDDRDRVAFTLNVMGEIYRQLGESQKALGYHSQALSLRRAAGDREGEGESLYNIGIAHWQLGDSQKALGYFNQALPLMRAVGTRPYILGALAVAYDALGRLPEAIDYLNQALVLHREVGNRRSEANTLNNLGMSYFRLGEWQKTLDYYNQALSVIRELGDRRREGGALNNIGLLYWELGENQKALEYYNQALPLQRATGDRNSEASTLHNIGAVSQSLGDVQQALAYYNQALSLARALGDRRGEAGTLQGLGTAYRSLGETQKALDFLNEALLLRRAVGDRLNEASTLDRIGATYLSLGKHEEAARYLEQGLSLQRLVGARSNEAETLGHLARAEQGRGRLAVARTQIEAALNIVEGMRSKFVGQQLRTSFSAGTREYYDVYINLLMQMHQKEPLAGHDVTAFGASERARARSLLDLLTESRADIRQGVDRALLERERSLQQQLNARSEQLTRLLSGKHTEEQETADRKEVEALLTDFQDVEAQIRIQSPRYAALTQPQPLSLKDIQQLLDQDTVLLEYALGEERSYAWVVTPGSVKSFELPKRAVIEAEARRIYGLLVNKSDDLDPAALTEISRMLLGPVADQLGLKRLLVVTDGALQYVPFGALPAPGVVNRRPYRPLILDHEVVSLPSASVVAVLRREVATRPPAPRKVAVLADPVFVKEDGRVKNGVGVEKEIAAGSLPSDVRRSADDLGLTLFDRLPVSRREAELITALAPRGQSLKALDFAASRATATSEELSRYQIVHFATHSLLNNQHPELSGIVLSLVNERGEPQDGFLRLHAIYNLKLEADLVVLSACETALGKEIKGEGLVGLTRGFMYAGAPRVVASLWKVGDSATAELMSRFYRNMLNARMRPAAALRAAQVAMWKERQWAAPFYWAGFVIQGEWR